MIPTAKDFRRAIDDYVKGRTAVKEFEHHFMRMRDVRAEHDWKKLDAILPGPHTKETLPELRRRDDDLARQGEVLPWAVQEVVDQIYVDLDLLGLNQGDITVDELRDDCRRALRELEELGDDPMQSAGAGK